MIEAIIVDDDPFMCDLLETMLSSLGVDRITTTQNGRDALVALGRQSQRPTVCFIDLHMPEMDGLELIRHLSELESKPVVVLMSGEDHRILHSARDIARARGVRVLSSLRKPVSRECLAVALEEAMASRALSSRPRTGSDPVAITVEELERAIHAGEIVAFYQPRIQLKTGLCTGLEALARWLHPQRGIIPPSAFISVAEASGLIDVLTWRLFEGAIADLADLQRKGHMLSASLNTTVDTLASVDFTSDFCTLAAKYDVPLPSLIVEVTESRLAAQYDRVLETLMRLRLRKVGVAIDDFGTGYSSMDQLRRIPFTELKIDRAFVRGASHDPTTLTILNSSVTLARELHMVTVAEGVETQEDWDLVVRAGCNEAQGYFMAKPMAKTHLESWLANWRAPTSNVFPRRWT